MNDAGKQAIKNAMSNTSDNLARAKMQKKADPSGSWRSGNGQTIDEVIERYEHHYDELVRSLDALDRQENGFSGRANL